MRTDNAVDIRLDAMLENCIFYISTMCEFSHGLGSKPEYLVSARTSAFASTGQSEQFHQSRLVESAIHSSVQYQDTMHQVTQYFVGQGSSLAQAQQQAFAWIGQRAQVRD
jgi:hypothetical protein